MIITTVCLVIAFKFFIVFLSSRESSFLTPFQLVSRRGVGVFPLLICPSRFSYFTIGIGSPHLRREILSDESSPKFRIEFHSQIWDTGISTFESENRQMKFRSDFTDNLCFLFSTMAVMFLLLTIWRMWKQYGYDDTLSPAFVLGFGLITDRILSSDDGDTCNSRAVTSSLLAMIYRFSQSLVNLIYFLCLWYNHQSRHEPIVAYGWFHCLVTVNQIQAMSLCIIYISYTIEIHKRLLCCYHEDIICSIPSSVLWRHWRGLSRQQWKTRRLPNKLRKCLLESSNILISMKRQDPESSSTTLSSYFQSKVMPKAFWSLSYMLIANNKYVKGGHNRFHLLARKAFDSRVTLHSFIEIDYNFLYLRTMVVLYFSVPCKLL